MLCGVTIRIGFYGAGLISGIHTFFLGVSGVDHRIVAVHDPDAERAAAWAARTGAQAVGEDELLDLVDAVYVCTWTAEHGRLVAKAAEAGKAVFCEKPLGFDAAEVEGMVDAVTRAGVTNQVGLVLRCYAPFRFVRQLLADERAGRPLGVVFRDDQFIPIQGYYASNWRADPSKAGRGTLLEHSIHDVDMLQWWLGPVASVSATTREHHGLARIDDLCAARLDFANGAAATLMSVWHDILERPSMRHVEIFAERMHAVIEDDFVGPVRWQFTGEPEQSLEGDELEAAVREGGDDRANPATAFLTAVRDGTPAEPDFAAALPAHRLVDALYRSADDGGALVTLPDLA
jgi:predicted dehydrogenase